MIMSLSDAISLLKERFKQNSIDLSESAHLLVSVMDETIKEIHVKHNKALNNRDYNLVRALIELSECLSGYQDLLQNIVSNLDVDDNRPATDDDFESDDESFLVDHNVVHTLFEDFTHTRPYGFEFRGNFYKVHTWREMMAKTCLLLANDDYERVLKFQFNPSLNGKKKPYFTDEPSELRTPVPIGDTVLYFEGNMSANSIRNLLKRIIQEFGFNAVSFKIFLRADYSSKWQG